MQQGLLVVVGMMHKLKIKKKIYNYSANAITKLELVFFSGGKRRNFCQKFKEFIYVFPYQAFGKDTLMNIYKPIYIELMNGQTHHNPVFSINCEFF